MTCPLPDPLIRVRVRSILEDTDVKKSRFTEAQIIGVLREQEAGWPRSAVGTASATDVLPLEGKVKWHVGLGCAQAEELGGREQAAEEAAGGVDARRRRPPDLTAIRPHRVG